MFRRSTDRRVVLYSIFLIFALLASGYAQDEGPVAPGDTASKANTNVYIVVMAQDPAISYQGGIKSLAATKPRKGQRFNAASTQVGHYRSFLKSKHDLVLQAIGGKADQKIYDYSAAINGFAAVMTVNEAAALAKQPDVAFVQKDQMLFAHTDTSPTFLGLDSRRGGPWTKDINGEGVIVGVIDTGIWPEHPSFADDGSYEDLGITLDSSVGDPCDFGNTSHNAEDKPFECNNKLLGARQFQAAYDLNAGITEKEYDSARDDEGHGTHTAATAAGNSNVSAKIFGIDRGTVSGLAPRARIIAYKGLGEKGGFSSDLVAAIDQAVADGCDVINYSVGSNATVLTADALAYLFAADAGLFVAVSAGNSGPEAGTIGSPATAPWVTSVGANTHNRTFISDITLKGPGKAPKKIWGGSVTKGITDFNLVDAEGIADVTGDTTGQCLNAFPEGTFKADDAVLCNQFDFGVLRTDRVAFVKEAGGGAVIFHNSAIVSMTPTDNHPLPTVHVLHEVGNPLKAYIKAHPKQVKISFAQSTARYEKHDHRVKSKVMASFSSRGPNPMAEDIIKPDITAPGISILAGAGPVHAGTAAQGQLFQSIMGTSMSSPHAAGLFALLKQAHPEWSPAMAKSALMTSASGHVLQEDGMFPTDPFDDGAGHVNVSPVDRNSAFSPGLVYDAGIDDYFGFLCGVAPEVFNDPEETCTSLAAEGIALDPSDLNLPSIAIAALVGRQEVTRTVTNVSDQAEVFWAGLDAPKGFSATIEPRVLKLAPQESATFTITFTGADAPMDEWYFGTLSWYAGKAKSKYHIESPIALRASPLDAPLSLRGEGESGTVGFDVRFGYTGAYQAEAGGLQPAVLVSDTVVQDPDQAFDPEDGLSNTHTFELAGASVFKLAIPPEATEAEADLDVFVYDPDGNLAATSTNPGTDEVITIRHPADGTWTVYVHGWAAPGGGSAYDLFSWVLVPGPDGSLVIDSAPVGATFNESGTVNAGWTHATAGQWYFGAISHTGPTGEMGLTLLDVDNR